MRAIYSILTAVIRPEIQERISIGLLLMGKEGTHFNYSRNKLAAVRNLLNEIDYQLFKDYLKLVEQKVIAASTLSDLKLDVLEKDVVLNEGYISYLSRYNNNVLVFTEPKTIDVTSDKLSFSRLYQKFVDSLDTTKPVQEKRSFEVFLKNYEPRLKTHFNIEREVTSNEIPNLLAPVKVDLMGINEIHVFAQTIEMEKLVYHVENDIAQLLFLKLALESKNKKIKEFVIASEPDKIKFQKQHSIWQNLRNTSEFDYVDISEAEKLIIYAEQHGVKPLVQTPI